MNTISFNLGFVLFFTLITWVFLANNFYLKIFFLKKTQKKRKNDSTKIDIFEQAYGGSKVPSYIKNDIQKCEDLYELLSLFLASQKFINLKTYKKLSKSTENNLYKDCVESVVGTNHKYFNCFLIVLRFLSIVGCFYLFFIFFDKILLSLDGEIPQNDKYILLSVLFLFVLMPYKVFINSPFLNKLFGLFVFVSSILLSLFTVVYVNNYLGDIIFNKLLLSIVLTSLIILIGAYSYVGYARVEYLERFFNLLKFNLNPSSQADPSTQENQNSNM
ncbi:hypothetical protein F7P75_10620 [Acinetobacter gandensis]|uniref:Uncharacterized protein n=1 Tax=Acinetobacter gandensis TaxID=1443941 RepID=A0A1A7R690_9GAMM|nr:hypothetical protein [Acinetobacter gandensis]KAB0625352.1 hypothetical protein F7P75_10620 [Acinetobacter gandensis]OBX27386.1 hypothetical protein A9J31_10785 [Acinetobacter gandensis]